MRYLLTRYVTLELLKVFLVTLTGMTLMIVLAGVGREAVRQGLGLGPVLRLVPYILPDALRFAVPATVLFAACSVYGRMSGMNEVVAVKSLGISPWQLMVPALVLGFMLSLASVWLNDVAVSWGRSGVQRVVVESVEQIAYGMLRTQRSYSTERFSINVKEVVDRKLVRPTVLFNSSGDSPQVTLIAEQAELRANPEESTLSIFLTHGMIDVDGGLSVFFPDRIERVIPLTHASKVGGGGQRAANYPLWKIPLEIVRHREELRVNEQMLAAQSAYKLTTGDFPALIDEDWRHTRYEMREANYQLDRLRTEPWRRWAGGFSCFFFVLVGCPLAMRLRNADFTTSFILCFLPILIVYYPLMAMGVDRAKAGAFPPYAVWIGNLICALVGVWLIRKAIRY